MKHKQYMISWQETVYWIIYEFTCFFKQHIHIWNSLGDRTDDSGKRRCVWETPMRGCGACGTMVTWALSQQFGPGRSDCCGGRHFNKMHLERTSLFTVQYFLGGVPKGEECISGPSFVSNTYCHVMTLPERLSWPFLSQGSPGPRGNIPLRDCRLYRYNC